MNNGKICVSVCAETAGEFIENIERAAKFADVIELRFDCLRETEFDLALQRVSELNCEKSFLATFRSNKQGGKTNLGMNERIGAWSRILKLARERKKIEFVDFEFNLKLHLSSSEPGYHPLVIRSFHDFQGKTENLGKTFNILIFKRADCWKIAARADDITDSLAVWKLLKTAKQFNKQIILIAMGEAGKWTRVLGLAHGAPLVYASLETGKETAAGQISARDLVETYRVKELNEETEIYGVVGNPVSHSLSPFMHNAAFKFHNLNAVYIPFEVKNLDEFAAKFIRRETREVELNFRGFSVTIPHKETIIKHLDFIDETAKAIGAVNTVKIENEKLFGFNTDADGFIEPLKNSYDDLKNARIAILGSGGAARAAIYALKKEAAEVTVFARNTEKAKILADEFEVESEELPANKKFRFSTYDIVVNATPLGTKGELENETPLFARQIEDVKLIYDLVYNPFETRFIKEARQANVPTIGGLAMLTAQAAAQFKIWTGKDAPVKEMSASVLRKLN